MKLGCWKYDGAGQGSEIIEFVRQLTRLTFANTNIKHICNQPNYRKRIDGIMHIIERKHRLEVKVRKVSCRDKSNASTQSISSQSNSPYSKFSRYKGKQYKDIENGSFNVSTYNLNP